MNDRRYQKSVVLRSSRLLLLLFMLYPFVFLVMPASSAAIISDRVAAFVDDQAITESELQEQYSKTLKISPDVTKEEVLNTMINRLLILREAKKYRIEGPSSDELIKEYIDLKVRTFIRVPETEIEKFYKENSSRFVGKEYDDARDDIEQYLIEKELNIRLKETLQELRKTAYIKILGRQGQ